MISIVVPTLNERGQIGNLLDSIRAQNFDEPIEVVVADAGSTDGTREFAESYRDKLNIRIVEGGKPPVARNRGARASRGETILFVDADTALKDRSFLAENIRYFRERGLAIGAAQLVPKSARILDRAIFGLGNFLMRILQYARPVGSVCMLFSRDALEKAGGYPEDRVMCEEHDLVEKAIRFGRYGILPRRALVSVRRFEKEGRLVALWKYAYSSLYRAFVGPITTPIFKYDFTYSEKENV